jgi:hypothetical protein
MPHDVGRSVTPSSNAIRSAHPAVTQRPAAVSPQILAAPPSGRGAPQRNLHSPLPLARTASNAAAGHTGAPPPFVQRKPVIAGPPVYRPARHAIAAPPVYRPGAAAPLQLSQGVTARKTPRSPRAASAAPPVYRPTVVGAHLQAKRAAITPQVVTGVNPNLTPRPAQHGTARPSIVPSPPNVVQRMEAVKKGMATFGLSVLTKAATLIYSLPNPFEMSNFTSCLCLVFNTAGRQDRKYKGDALRDVVFESIKATWEQHHTKDTFYDVCPYDELDNLTDEWQMLMMEDKKSSGALFGERPLIAIVGHCAPGASAIRSDDQKEYGIPKVMEAIGPALKSRATIYLTPCNTGVASDASASFQEKFTRALPGATTEDFKILTIGTTSKSVPAEGKVLTTGHTYALEKQKSQASAYTPIEEKEFLRRQQKK